MKWLGSYNTHEAWHYDKSTEPKECKQHHFVKNYEECYSAAEGEGCLLQFWHWECVLSPASGFLLLTPEAWEQGGGEVKC